MLSSVDAFIVGAGASGFLHALALRSAGVRIGSVYDPRPERATWLADLCGARAVPDLDGGDAGVVAICSPPACHVAQAERLARPDRITFVEKPVACDAAELARLARLPGIVPVLQWRAGRSARQLRAAFAGHRVDVRCEIELHRDADYFAARPGWGANAMLSIGIHAVDLIVWIVGRPVVRSRLEEPTPTRGSLAVDFDDGSTARIAITLDAPGRSELALTVRHREVAAVLRATEEDPTARPAEWSGMPAPDTDGATGSPLLVPFVHEALAGRAPSVSDVAAAHALAFSA